MKKCLFLKWEDWRKYLESAVAEFFKGFVRIIYAILTGIASLLYAAATSITKLVKKHPIPSLGALCIVLFVCMVFMFVHYSVKAKAYEEQRDSISYELLKIQSALGGDTIVVGHKIKLHDDGKVE